MFKEPNRNVNFFYETSKEQIEKIKTTIKNNNYMLAKYKAALTDAGVLVNNTLVEDKDLTDCERETFNDYLALQRSQENIKNQLKELESVLEKMGQYLPVKNDNSRPHTLSSPGAVSAKK